MIFLRLGLVSIFHRDDAGIGVDGCIILWLYVYFLAYV